jgi:geranylgeranyl diphosphate synthase, type II
MKQLGIYAKLIEDGLQQLPAWQRQPQNLYEPIRYILQLGGKRLRPALALMAAKAFGANPEEALPQALAVELFHNFSLIHDDIMDKAPLRRGAPTVHEKWDANAGILSGDAMLVLAYKELANCKPEFLPALLRSFNLTALEVCEGQQMDMNFETQDAVTQEDYLQMICLKTSVLLGCALQMGAIVAGANEQDARLIYDFGCKLGIAFQIQDDILDVFGDPEKFGKTQGGDLIAGKKTILMLHALRHPELGQTVKETLAKITGAARVAHLTPLWISTGAKAYAEKVMRNYYDEALEALHQMSISREQLGELENFAAYLFYRDH